MASPAVRSSDSANTVGFMMRPAVCSAYSSRFSTSPDSWGRMRSSTAADSSSGSSSISAAASSDGRSSSHSAMRSGGWSASRPAPGSTPYSISASIARRLSRSTRRLNASWRFLSVSSPRTSARSAGRCFWRRFRRLADAPIRCSRLTESSTTSIRRWKGIVPSFGEPSRTNAATSRVPLGVPQSASGSFQCSTAAQASLQDSLGDAGHNHRGGRRPARHAFGTRTS